MQVPWRIRLLHHENLLEDPAIVQPNRRLPHEGIQTLQEGCPSLGSHVHQVSHPPETKKVQETRQETKTQRPSLPRELAQLL